MEKFWITKITCDSSKLAKYDGVFCIEVNLHFGFEIVTVKSIFEVVNI